MLSRQERFLVKSATNKHVELGGYQTREPFTWTRWRSQAKRYSHRVVRRAPIFDGGDDLTDAELEYEADVRHLDHVNEWFLAYEFEPNWEGLFR
jgi:hypothetical protein